MFYIGFTNRIQTGYIFIKWISRVEVERSRYPSEKSCPSSKPLKYTPSETMVIRHLDYSSEDNNNTGTSFQRNYLNSLC